jgi:hypothetical protein
MSRYILIVYKPSSEDYCRGCLMASYGADHEVFDDLSVDDLVEKWADYIYANMHLGCNEAGYEFWIFRDGIKVIEESQFCYYYDGEDDEFDDSKVICEIMSIIETKANELANVYEKDRLAKEKKLREDKKAAEEKEALLKRQAAYEKLKKEFGGPN